MERILQKRYRILRSLGRGGLGAVYLCDDLRLAGKQWALKQMHSPEPDMLDRFRETFDREAATLSRLRHPNLPLIVDYFEQGTDSYLVMEYVEGENLAECVRRRGPLAERDAFDKGLALADLLIYLHGQTPPIIFRDLKPENVMLTPDAELKLVDFGLARRFVPGKRSDTVPSGSVGYAAPEQWEDLSQTDERSDIYSWGATVVHLLSGKIPSPVFPLSALRDANPAPSDEARRILDRCLKARPRERYANAVDLSNEVRSHLAALDGSTATEQAVPREVVAAPVAAAAPARRDSEVRASAPSRISQVRASTSQVRSTSSQFRTTPARSSSNPPAAPPAPRPKVPAQPSAVARWWSQRVARDGHSLFGFVLMTLATLTYLCVLLAQIPQGFSKPLPHSSPDAGVGPFRPHDERNEKTDQGKRLYEQGKWTEAIAVLDEATTRYPDDAEAHLLKENAYVRLSGSPYFNVPVIAAMSGPDANEFASQLNGLALAQATVNARGGVRGKKIVVSLYDDQSNSATCLRISKKLVDDPTVLVVLGPYNSQRTVLSSSIYDNARCTMVSPTASGEKVWESGPYVLGAADSTARRVQAMAHHLVHLGCKRIAVVYDQTSTISAEMAKTFEDQVEPDGCVCLKVTPYPDDARDFSTQIEQIQKMAPDAVLLCEFRAVQTALFAIQLRRAGVKVTLAAQTIPLTRDLVDLGGDAVNGLIISSYFHPQINTPRVHAFVAAFHRKFDNLTPTHLAMCTVDAFDAVVAALESADGRQGINDYLSSAGRTRPPFDGIVGPFTMSYHLDQRPVYIIEVANARYRLLEDESAELARKPATATH